MAATRVAVVFAVALAVAATPAAAATRQQGGLLGAFRLAGSHGFKILGLPYVGAEGHPSGIILMVDKRGETVTYSAPAEVSQTAVRADLEPIGEIDLQVVPTGVEKSAQSSCGGKKYSYEGATFEGTIDFHGEEGFTEVEATRTPLLVAPLLDFLCAGAGGLEVGGYGIRGARLRLNQNAGQRGVSLQLNQNRPRGPVRYEAQIEEKRGSLRIFRAVVGHLPGRSFSYDDDLKSAEFRAARPFSGSAAYRASASGGSWSGDLTVDFPGRGGVALTGSNAGVSLTHVRRTESELGK